MPGKGRTRANWPFKLLCAVLVALLFEAALQLFYRVTAGQFLPRRIAVPIYQFDPYSGYGVKPNLAYFHATSEYRVMDYTNSQGFRVSARREEFPVSRQSAGTRILLLGPSFAFGWGVNYEDSFGRFLPLELERRGFGPQPVELINSGVPGLATADQLSGYERKGRFYRPDLLVQIIYGSFFVRAQPGGMMVQDGYLVAGGWQDHAIAYAKSFATVFYGWIAYTRLAAALSRQPEARTPPPGVPVAAEESLLAAEFADSMRYYELLRRAAARDHARLLVVFVPVAYIIHPGDKPRWERIGAEDIASSIKLNTHICEYLKKQGIECLNLTPALQEEAGRSPERMYYWLDMHWTPKGNRIAAQAVAQYLTH